MGRQGWGWAGSPWLFFSLFPDSLVAADGLPSCPRHLGSQLISSLMPVARALYLAQWSFPKLGFWAWGPLDEGEEGLRNGNEMPICPSLNPFKVCYLT